LVGLVLVVILWLSIGHRAQVTGEAGAALRGALLLAEVEPATAVRVRIRAVPRGAGAAGAMFMSGTTQVNMMITPSAQKWMFQKVRMRPKDRSPPTQKKLTSHRRINPLTPSISCLHNPIPFISLFLFTLSIITHPHMRSLTPSFLCHPRDILCLFLSQ
jgi:hypothetical protein